MKGFIAIDGGGSKTELVLCDLTGHIYVHMFTDSTNPNDIGLKECLATLKSAIKRLLDRAKKYNLIVESVLLAIAGVEFGDTIDNIKNHLLQTLNISNINIVGDLASVVEMNLSSLDTGVVLISGTGFNMAFKENKKISTIGGWGYLVDNYLSGFDLGKDALVAASKSIDGIGKKTCLVKMLEKYFSNSLWYSMDEIYKSGIKGVAKLSKLLIEAYLKDDEVAKEIIETRVNNLASVIKKKSKNKPCDIYLCGGLIENNSCLVKLLNETLDYKYNLIVSNKRVIYGASLLAVKSMKATLEKSFQDNFNTSYKELLK